MRDRGSTPPFSVGDQLGVKSKHGEQAYVFRKCRNVTFERVRWTQESRGVFKEVERVVIRNCAILRAPAIHGVVPFLSTPGGGPQIGQPSLSHGGGAHFVADNNFVGTGDDAIAFFNVRSATARRNRVADPFNRGILNFHIQGASGYRRLTLEDNLLVRCGVKELDTHHSIPTAP